MYGLISIGEFIEFTGEILYENSCCSERFLHRWDSIRMH